MRYIAAIIILLAAMPGLCEPQKDEVCRIRIANRKGGLVQVSTDGGATYAAVGRVMHPANTRITGFAAASYTPHGTVAATAVHGLRIKTGQFALGVGKAQMPLIFSIVPLEFTNIPNKYGGHIPRSSGILTDIFAGRSIFRNLAPYVGNPVYIEENRCLAPLPEDYNPRGGETFVIVVGKPERCPQEVHFENKAGGKVTARYADGTCEALAEVIRPVVGVGRYDGTTFTGVGSINTNHGGVITISTAPICPPRTVEGGEVETRGGFMVQPYYHVREQQEGAVQVMVIGFKDEKKPILEGTPPLFCGCIGLSRYPNNPERSFRVQVSIDNGPWEDSPELVGRIDDAFTPVYLESYFTRIDKPRKVEQGLTSFRLLFPESDPKLVADDLTRESADYTTRALHSGEKRVRGTVVITPRKALAAKSMVTTFVDGKPICTSNESPYSCEWDTTRFPNGFHEIRIESCPVSGGYPIAEYQEMLVVN